MTEFVTIINLCYVIYLEIFDTGFGTHPVAHAIFHLQRDRVQIANEQAEW